MNRSPPDKGRFSYAIALKSVKSRMRRESHVRICEGLEVKSLRATRPPLTTQAHGTAPPKVLVVTREFLKPGRGGSPHEKTESAFVQAMAAAKWPTQYIGADALSGANQGRSRRALGNV